MLYVFFLHNSFEEKKCDVMVRILPSTQRSKIQLFSQLFLSIDKMDESFYKTLSNFFKLVIFKKRLP